MDNLELIPNLFRTEYSKMVAVLSNVFGLKNIEIAEDLVSDTFLLSAESWKIKGVPENQVGWLYTVARNKTRDYLRREKVKTEKINPNLKAKQDDFYDLDIELTEENISDSQLKMIFAICHPSISNEAQIALALRILCGFGVNEIASALLTNKEVINKRMFRAKQSLKKENKDLIFPGTKEIESRLDQVLRTIYLLFNEGYYSAHPEKLIRKDLCLEAMRLNILLVNHTQTNLPKVSALLSLMCFHASRFEAREDSDGHFVLYADQDRVQWDQDLIERGEFYLNKSSTGKTLNKYHLEAAIAYWHTQIDDEEKWENILQLYNYLLQIEYSPIAALNRTYALAKANHVSQAIEEALKLDLKHSYQYHVLLAKLYESRDTDKQIYHLQQVILLSRSESIREFFSKKLALLK